MTCYKLLKYMKHRGTEFNHFRLRKWGKKYHVLCINYVLLLTIFGLAEYMQIRPARECTYIGITPSVIGFCRTSNRLLCK